MKLDLKKNSDYSRTLNIHLNWDDIKNDYYKEYKKVKSSYQIPGFRKGKVPPLVIKNQFVSMMIIHVFVKPLLIMLEVRF